MSDDLKATIQNLAHRVAKLEEEMAHLRPRKTEWPEDKRPVTKFISDEFGPVQPDASWGGR